MKKTLVKSRSKKFGAILTVSSLLTVNFLSPVAALAQGSPDIQMAEEGDFVHDPDDIVLPDLGKLDDLKTLEVERGHFDVSDIEEPNPTHQMEVEVGTFEELQRVIDEAVPDTALVINITDHFEFNEVIRIEEGLDITLQSEGDYTLTQRNGRHFIVESNSLLTLGEGVTLDGASQAGGVEVRHATFNLRGGHIKNNTSSVAGGGIYAHNGRIDLMWGSVVNNTSFAGGAIYVSNGMFYTFGTRIQQNSAEYGGGLFITDSFVSIQAHLYENSATFGGGLFVNDDSTGFIRGHINDNSAEYGGGIFYTDSTVDFGNMYINGNSADYGGGMYLVNGTVNTGLFYYVNNSAEYGGGVFLADNSTLKLGNPTFSENSATTAGGGAYIFDNSTMTLTQGYIQRNNADVAGGGVYIGPTGNFEMNNNNPYITHNHAFQGGGVVVSDSATFTMRSGLIALNTATISCAVMVYPGGTFNYEGGDIWCEL